MNKKSKQLQILCGSAILTLILIFIFLYTGFPAFRLSWVSSLCFLLIVFLILGLSLLLKWKVDKHTAIYSKIIYWGLLVIFLVGIIRGLTGI